MTSHLHASLLIYRPLRDGWLSWPCWLTDSGRLNHKLVTHPASSLPQDRESSPAKTSVLSSNHYTTPPTNPRKILSLEGSDVNIKLFQLPVNQIWESGWKLDSACRDAIGYKSPTRRTVTLQKCPHGRRTNSSPQLQSICLVTGACDSAAVHLYERIILWQLGMPRDRALVACSA